ncbi:hypothetical protein OS189_11265 [Sulfitobacter sp. F26169L]|nr:hypothetical protein [Sulfitobacter sp. F26169L]MCX7566919.1 hypothetical protein [Sulfitobacter sp. F26169L]
MARSFGYDAAFWLHQIKIGLTLEVCSFGGGVLIAINCCAGF